jgi:hypothetical protein
MFRKPAMNVHWRKSTKESQGKPKQKIDAPSGTIFIISKCVFKEASTHKPTMNYQGQVQLFMKKKKLCFLGPELEEHCKPFLLKLQN